MKKTYSGTPALRLPIILLHLPVLYFPRWVLRALTGRLQLERGMSLWHDMLDWLGGFPFEVAAPGSVVDFFEGKGLKLLKSKTCGRRMGCNEFVFLKP